MITDFNLPKSNTHAQPTFSGGNETGRGEKRKALLSPIDTTAADAYRKKQKAALDAFEKAQKDEDITPEEFEKKLREYSGLSGSFVKTVEEEARSPEASPESQFFIQKFHNYLPELKKQAADPKHPFHHRAKCFLADYAESKTRASNASNAAQETNAPGYLPATRYSPEKR